MKRPHVDPESRGFRVLAELVLRHRLLTLLIVMALTGGSIHLAATRMTTNMQLDAFLSSGSETLQALEEFRDLFGRDDVYLVMVEGDVFSMPFLLKLRKLHRELAGMNLELPSLGKRHFGGRHLGEFIEAQKRAFDQPAKKTVNQKSGPVKAETGPTEDDFGDFEKDIADDGPEGKPAPASDRLARIAAWGEEAGGTVVDEIVSLINVRQTRGRKITREDGAPGIQLEVGELMKPWPEADDLQAIRAKALRNPAMVGRVVDAKGQVAVVVVRTRFMDDGDSKRVCNHITAIISKYSAPGFRTSLAGMPTLIASLVDSTKADAMSLSAVSMLALLVALVLFFRHPVGVVAPLLVVVVAISWTFGFMTLAGLPMTTLSAILPAFIICVGVGDSVHIMSIFRDQRRAGVEHHEAIVRALAISGVAVFYTTLTTAVGLLSFQFATIDAIGEMGLAGAVGTSAALVVTLLLMPIFLSVVKTSTMSAENSRVSAAVSRFLNGCASLAGRPCDAPPGTPVNHRRRRLTLLGAVVVAGVALLGASLLRVHHDPMTWVPEGQDVRVAFEKMDQEMGGTGTVQLLVKSKSKHGIKDIRLLRALEELRQHILAYRHKGVGKVIGNAIHILDVVKETNRALHGGDEAYYRIPDTQRAVSDTLFLFENSGPEQLRRLASADLHTTQMTVRVKWMEATAYGPLTKYIDEGIDKYIGKLAQVSPTGSAYTLFMTVSSLIVSQLESFVVAMVVITVFMVLLSRSVRLGLLSMVPNLLPILCVIGLMGFTGIPIDLVTLLIASIAIGIAVDDTIHFVHHFKEHYDTNGNVEAAIAFSFQHSGQAMVGTSAILASGFAVFYVGTTLSGVQNFGLLVGATVIFALLLDLLLTPALLRTVYRDKSPQRQ